MADIGSTLREARMRARIDITEVETRTKIRAKYLRALENEEWDLLPGPVYVKSFLRTYGDYLGLDSRTLVDEYKRRYERLSDHDLRPIAALSRDRERHARGPLLPPWAIIGGVLVAVVVALYIVGTANKGTTTAQTVSTPKPAPGARHHRPAPPPRPTTVKLQMAATGSVYICLVDGTGRKLIPGVIYAPGQTIPVETAPKLLLTLGNASVRVRANGRLIPVAPSANAIRLLLGPGAPAWRPIPLSATPTCT
jgi:hypothetical protein